MVITGVCSKASKVAIDTIECPAIGLQTQSPAFVKLSGHFNGHTNSASMFSAGLSELERQRVNGQ